MNALLADLYGHQAWADAELWRAIGAHQPARDDQVIRNRLHHIHLVQRLFLWLVGSRQAPPTVAKPEDFERFEDLKAYARAYHDDVGRYLQEVGDERLADAVSVPWAPSGAPTTLTVAEALMQSAMHSHYHRGQNAVRLRELGGEPPITDLIMWYWTRRKAPDWD